MEGNQQKLREALVSLRDRFNNNVMAYQDRYFKFSGWHWHKKAKEAARWRDVFQKLKEVCDAALSAPARNCDVGTPEEQERRYERFCDSHKWVDDEGANACLADCPLYNTSECALHWAQTPYAEEGGNQ